ncbi:protein S100-P-like isoform X2 [Gadus macrocephalus]|uniref:protein S100-P-like isoform X2 n=1 Tax=Gadus macrocephalus TaxID=80720 RepID=UPI0028CBA023|nr:protein S100-P-like isoform X2 [Gadus macrocephalus]
MSSSNFDLAPKGLKELFLKHAGKSGKKDSMNKGELKALLHELFPGLLENAKDPEAVDKLMKALDHNNDCEVDFDEFVVLITAVVNASGRR